MNSVETLSLRVESAKPAKSEQSINSPPPPVVEGGNPRLSAKERLVVLDQLAILLDSGIQIPAALETILSECTQPRASAVLGRVHSEVLSGRPLSEAMTRLPKAFPPLVSQMVRAGEASGTTAEMLTRTVEMLEGDALLRSKLRSAMLYPTLMIFLTLGVVIFLLAVIVPKFQRLFEKKAAALPMPTQWLLAMGEFSSTYGLWILIGAGVSVAGAVVFVRTARGAGVLDRVLLKTPLVGGIYNMSVLARCVRTLGLLIESGVPIHSALEHTRDVATSPSHTEMWERSRQHIVNGGTLTEAVRGSSLVSPSFQQIVSAGEATAHLDRAMLKTADRYTRELERKTRDLMTVIEPTMVVVMGGVVGFIALSIMLPIFRLSSG